MVHTTGEVVHLFEIFGSQYRSLKMRTIHCLLVQGARAVSIARHTGCTATSLPAQIGEERIIAHNSCSVSGVNTKERNTGNIPRSRPSWFTSVQVKMFTEDRRQAEILSSLFTEGFNCKICTSHHYEAGDVCIHMSRCVGLSHACSYSWMLYVRSSHVMKASTLIVTVLGSFLQSHNV